jgi:hypothetical protein
MRTISYYINWIGHWSVVTFGPTTELVVDGLFRKIKDEIDKFKESREVEELADVFILFCQAMYRLFQTHSGEYELSATLSPFITSEPVDKSINLVAYIGTTVDERLDAMKKECNKFIFTRQMGIAVHIYLTFLTVLRDVCPISFEQYVTTKMRRNFGRTWNPPDTQGRVQHASEPNDCQD